MKPALTVWLLGLALALSATPSAADNTITLQAQADASVRSDISARANDNYGCDPFLVVGGYREPVYGAADGIRTLLRFDLSGITQPVDSAILQLRIVTVYSFSPPQVYQLDVHRVVASGVRTPWIEGNGAEIGGPFPNACVWVDSADGVAWIGAGDGGDANNQTQPDFDPTRVARTIINEADLPWVGSDRGAGVVISWDITALVNDWISGASVNYGLVLRDVTTDGTFKHIFFSSRETDFYTFPDPRALPPGPRLVLTPGPLPVDIDIKPGSDSNPINLGSHGTVPVAILSSATFDATTVDPPTVTLASAPVRLKGKSTLMASFEDVNSDGRPDLVVHVSTSALQLTGSDTVAVLEGQTFSGERIRGTDTVRIVP